MMGIAFLVTCLNYSYFCIVCVIIVCSRRNKYTVVAVAAGATVNISMWILLYAIRHLI